MPPHPRRRPRGRRPDRYSPPHAAHGHLLATQRSRAPATRDHRPPTRTNRRGPQPASPPPSGAYPSPPAHAPTADRRRDSHTGRGLRRAPRRPVWRLGPMVRAPAAIGLWPRRLVAGLIRAYQIAASPFPSPCRFTPTCSSYALEAVRRYGALRGGWLGLRRILRCHPFGRSGLDPVP
jgi:hypothetical protein